MSVIRKFFGNGNPAPRDEKADAQSMIDQANQANAELRLARADVDRLKDELATARERVAQAREQLNLSEPAAERLREAQEADAADRERRVANGTPGADGALAVAIDRALHDQKEAESAENAARKVLPALEARVADVQAELHNAELRIDWAVWKRRVAELSTELPEVRAAASVVSGFALRCAALKDIDLRGRAYGVPRGHVPEELTEACQPAPILESELQSFVRTEIEYLKRLRDSEV